MLNRRTLLLTPLVALPRALPLEKTRLLIVTGGHAFEEKPFLKIFERIPGLLFEHVRFGAGAEQRLNPEASQKYDAMLFYDMHQDAEPHWGAWMRLLAEGMPSIFLHHALGSYRDVPEYLDVVGGRGKFSNTPNPGDIYSFWKHDEEIRVHIADRAHEITKGLDDFTIHDEVYRGFYVRPDVHVLLTTDHPLNDQKIAWTYRYKRSPIVYLQLGHDHQAYENENFQKLIGNSIQWAISSR